MSSAHSCLKERNPISPHFLKEREKNRRENFHGGLIFFIDSRSQDNWDRDRPGRSGCYLAVVVVVAKGCKDRRARLMVLTNNFPHRTIKLVDGQIGQTCLSQH
jgi:hypothetical protein